VDPIYPPAAKLGRIQGSVVINANIATDGSVRHIRVLSGQPLLAQAAVDAVKGWRYRPHIVRGKPIETTTQIVLNFKLMANPRISSASR
jgi:protein TonB